MSIQNPSRVVFDNSYARLPERFFAPVAPAKVAAPSLIRLNVPLARDLGLDPEWLSGPEGVAMLAGNSVVPGSEPIAMAYAGHQFGNFVPRLGDGRAILLGEVMDRNNRRRDIQLKGSGRTPFSRSGDGRAAIGPVLREYVVSEAFAALAIPTTRSLAAVATGEYVYRETPLPGAVLTRVAASHIRVGTFQYFAARKDVEAIQLLADHVIARHYPDCSGETNVYRALLDRVIGAQAALVAQWMLVGFIHGVMNTDNMSIAGETIDFGPCAFMDTYHPATVYSSIDHQGRYAYANQPAIAQWNLVRLAETLLPLLAPAMDEAVMHAQDLIDSFPDRFQGALLAGYRAKLGLRQDKSEDLELIQDFLTLMAKEAVDFTTAFRRLCDAADGEEASLRSVFLETEAMNTWLQRWQARLVQEDRARRDVAAAMRSVNPLYIPRNHQVERVIRAAVSHDDFGPFEALLDVLARPFDDRPGLEDYTLPPRPEEVVHQTFCGT